jgi:Peptidase_C39 like family
MRWALAVAAGLATFCTCWWGLEAGAGWQLGDALGLAAVPFTVVFGVASYWASQQHDSGGSTASAPEPSVAVSNVIQVVDHPTAPVLAGDYRGARISFGPSRKAMIAAVAAILAVDTAAIAIWAAVSARPAPGSESGIAPGQEAGLSVPAAPWVTDGNGVTGTLTGGDRIRYAFYVDNSTGKTISANVRFDAYWGTRDELLVNIFNIRFQQYIPPGRTTVYSPLAIIPGDALPGRYTEQADVADRIIPSDRAGQYGSFGVRGPELLSVPCYVQPARPQVSGADGGPASVAMVLNSRPRRGEPTVYDVQEFVASYVEHGAPNTNRPVSGEDLEYVLEHYGIPDSEISQISQDEPGNPQAQLTDMAIAIKQGSPVIAFVDGADLPTEDGGERNYTAHWLVVVGFGLGSGNQTEVLVNDPDGTRGSGGVKGQPIALSAFGQAVMDAGNLPIAQQEPDHISGIVVMAGLNPGGPVLRRSGRRHRDSSWFRHSADARPSPEPVTPPLKIFF